MKKTRLFLELADDPEAADPQFGRPAADGWVVGAELVARLEPARAAEQGFRVLVDCEPACHPGWDQLSNTAWVKRGGLEDLARLRDRWPSLRWIPMAQVYRPKPRFDFRQQFHEEGFKTYVPDLTTYRRFHVAEVDLDLGAWLERADELGYGCVWLHGAAAAVRGRGLDLEMMERGRGLWSAELWISGGVAEERHLSTLAEGGHADAVIVPAELAQRCGIGSLRQALAPRLAVEIGNGAVPVDRAAHEGAARRCGPAIAGT